MLSGRKATVSYAIDLLRAHQIRRENLFLHEELKRCCREIAALREEVKAATTAMQASNESSEKIRCMFEGQNMRLSDRDRSLETLQQAYWTMQSDVSRLQTMCTETREQTQTQWDLLKREIDAMKANWQRVADIPQKQGLVIASLERLQHTVDGKADASVVEALTVRVSELSVPPEVTGRSLPSVSRVEDSFEPRHSSCLPARDDAIHVRDSQSGHRPPSKDLRHEQHQTYPLQQRGATVPDDLDLDENAHTFSYLGHRRAVAEKTDTLQTLPQPDIPSSQLAQVNLLRQRRFDDWEYYYSNGSLLVEALPHTFEETIVRNFVDGIFSDLQRKQCQQWLDAKGWTWEYIGLFGRLCSELAGTDTDTVLDTTEASTSFRKVKEALGALEEKSKTQPKPRVVQETKGPGRQAAVLRRSQRLVDKETRGHSQRQSMQFPVGSKLPDAASKTPCRPGDEAHAARPDWTNGIDQPPPKQPRTMQQDSPSLGFHESLAPVARIAERRLETFTTAAQQTDNRDLAQGLNSTPRKEGDEVEVPCPSPTMAKGVPSMPVVPELQRKRGVPMRSVPQLVPHKRLAKCREESSNDEGFLQKPEISQHQSRETMKAKQRKHKRRHLPLPPPPEIPILSTSSEE